MSASPGGLRRDGVSSASSTGSSSASWSRESYGGTGRFDDLEPTTSTVARFLEQLHANMSSALEKELITTHLLAIVRARKDARALVGSHSQAMPLFISILRSGTLLARMNVASMLSAICKEEDLRVKVLLGGCIPPLLSLLRSESLDARKAAAEAIYEVTSGGLSEDHIGMKIFVTEGVVPTLWDQLNPNVKQDRVVEGFVTGALRNLCGDKDGYWRATLEAGGVEIITGLLCSDNVSAQSNAASLLARLIVAFGDGIPKVMDAGASRVLLNLLGPKNDIAVRASAADALDAISSKSPKAKQAIVEANGIPVLIAAIIAPSKECMEGESCHALQEHAICALANICGGMPSLILYLGELSQAPCLAASVADIIGALAYSIMVYDDEEEPDVVMVENILVTLLKSRDDKSVQDGVLEALASLYGNSHLSRRLDHAEAKKVLIGLVTMAAVDAQKQLINSLTSLCSDHVGIWAALAKREGIQLLISLLGLSGEQHQEYAVWLLAILTDQVDDSKWAITAAGGIPPLVQLLETGSQKAREYAAHILWNLCCHSDDIRACVESAGSIPALLWLLKCGGPKAQEASSRALRKLILDSDSVTINQLLALLLGGSSDLKAHAISVLGHVLSMATSEDLVQQGTPANTGLRSLVQHLNSSNEENQESAASVLADLFSSRPDICDSLATDEIINSCMKLLSCKTQVVATQSARVLGALSRPMKAKPLTKVSCITEGDVQPLIELTKTSFVDLAETAVAALANLLSDPHIAEEALADDVVSALTRVLAEGSPSGKRNASRAFFQLLNHFSVYEVLRESCQCRFVVLALADSLNEMNKQGVDCSDTLDVLAFLVRLKHIANFVDTPWSALSEVPESLECLIQCLVSGVPSSHDRVIQILSRLCRDRSVLLGDLLVGKSGAISSLATRIVRSPSLEVRVGGAALLICSAKEHKQLTIDALDESGFLEELIYALVDMVKHQSSSGALKMEGRSPENSYLSDGNEFDVPDPATVLGGTVALWLLSIISSFHAKCKLAIMEAGAMDILSSRLASYVISLKVDFENTEMMWITALLLAILFQHAKIALSPATIQIIPSLAVLLKSDEIIDRYFAGQSMASLVGIGDKAINLAIANSGAIAGLISLIGHVESDMTNLLALSNEFSLVKNPDQYVLDTLFKIEDIRSGATARKSIPLLIDLLRPIADRPGAPPIAVHLLIEIAEGSDANKVTMAEAGALDALTKYLSLSPQDSTEASIADLLRVLFGNPDLIHHEAAFSCLSQLIAVLRLGSRCSRLNAALALQELFTAENLRDTEMARQAIQPLVDMLNSGSEREQHASLVALMKLTSGSSLKASIMMDVEGNPIQSLYKIMSSSSSLELKSNAARLCFVLFGNPKFRSMPITSECINSLLALMSSECTAAVESSIFSFERLLDDEHHAVLAATPEVVELLVRFVSGSNFQIAECSLSCLIKLGKDRSNCKLAMVEAGIIDNALEMLFDAPGSVCSSTAELLRILTNNSGIAKSSAAARVVEPLFLVLQRADLTMWGQHSALQTLVNILEKPQSLTTLKLTPSEVIQPLISFLESPSQAIQQLGTELLSHLLALEHFQQDITTRNAIGPLVQLVGIGILSLQQTAAKALESISSSWPESVIDAGGIFELSKVIIQDDPEPSEELKESAGLVLSNLLCLNLECYHKVSVVVLVRLLWSTLESTVSTALKGLIFLEAKDASNAVLMAQAGAVDALLTLLRSHQCEEASGRLLEALFNNLRVREMKVSKYSIVPLSQYLLDPLTKSQSARFLATLALGDLFQHDSLARTRDAASACRALVSLLEDQPTEEMKMVAICALQNLVVHSRTNRRAVAEAGGILVIQELLLSQNPEVAGQTALLIKFLFSNHTLQEYVSNELIRSLTASLERELWDTATANEEVLRTILVIFTNFKKLRTSEAATLCIPHLVGALKAGNEAAQEAALDTLCLLKNSWPDMNEDVAKAQALTASEAIPILQLLMKTCPPSFHDRADSLLHRLPGCLTVTVRRGNNLKQTMGSTNAFCQLTIGNGPPRLTKVINHSTCPEWKEGFTWAFDIPPKGQKLYILCKSKNTFGKCTLGRVTIQIDKVVSEGVYSGLFSLSHDSNRDGSSRSLEIEIVWSNRTSNEGNVSQTISSPSILIRERSSSMSS